MKRIVLAVMAIGLLGFFGSLMSDKEVRAGITCSLPIVLQNGTTADANQVMSNFNALVNCFLSVATVSQITCGVGLDGGIITAVGTCSLSAARRTMPTVQNFQVGSPATYTTPANVQWIEVWMVGGGGGGSGTTGNGGTGGTSTFSTASANGGSGGAQGTAIGIGGTATSCTLGIQGQSGLTGVNSIISAGNGTGGAGGSSPYWGGGGAGGINSAGNSAVPLTGGGGGGYGASSVSSIASGAGGGSGGFCWLLINNPAASYSVSAGTGGAGGTGGLAGGNGAQGYVTIVEHYGT